MCESPPIPHAETMLTSMKEICYAVVCRLHVYFSRIQIQHCLGRRERNGGGGFEGGNSCMSVKTFLPTGTSFHIRIGVMQNFDRSELLPFF